MLPAFKNDREFIVLVDAALADAARRSGPWLACRPGCNQCCTGVFAISEHDADRLRRGLDELASTEKDRYSELVRRVEDSVARLQPDFPGDPVTGMLGTSDLDEDRFQSFANEEVCPVLNPATGLCDLYNHRPLTCRTFGPPVRTGEGALGVCELCFVDAPEQAIAAAEMHLPPSPEGLGNQTIVTFVLASRQTDRME